ncbi:autotransporter assembly complex protein TamA [Sphingomonas solaris]|uniref:BamA/TamA family outer membrane protein n=1 Tax=Alterirhizorhabdus solaris TaxID=2529389 RepID=A0A558QX51_9SPHN|nr:BamA/TamA family outer membrane protein [Sphingomonas solaris]TVV71746.1 BamA/TamA family outer membrane protein [Sphingomonas solaris]
MHPAFARRILPAALVLSCVPVAAAAQEAGASDPVAAPPPVVMPDSAALDPASPLEPLPGLGVDWPDLAAPDAAPGQAAAAAALDPDATQRYRFAIEGIDGLDGVDPVALRQRFDQVSSLAAGEGKSANVAQVDRRAREDEEALRDLLRAYGYYDAVVTARVEAQAAGGAIRVTLAAEPGPVYRFATVDLGGLAAAGDKAAALRRAYPIAPGDIVNADKVTAAEAGLRTSLGREGFAFAKIAETKLVIDHETRQASLVLMVQPEGAQRFGAIAVRGKPLFTPKHLGEIARFAPGDPYDAARIEDFRRALIQTGLVSAVVLTPVPSATPGVVDIAVQLERAPRRTVAGELGYGTGEGIRTELSWQHRNLIKPEGAVTFRGVAGTQEQSLGAALRRSNYGARDRVLTAQAVASHTNRNAYDAKTFTVGAGIERQTNIIWQKKWVWSLGGELTASDERDVVGLTAIPRRRTFFIAAVPTSLAYDGSDDLLNPSRGYRLSGRLSPEASLQNGAFGYARAQIDGSAYLPVTGFTSLAGRIRLGTIMGASRDRIAPSRRFYSGGGGSVRGYGYQAIGPRDANNDPVGGRSLTEFAIEARVRFGDFGVVPFLDGGNLYTQALPRFTGLRYGAGIGARYYTSFGPIRVDVGTPLNRRPGDSRVAVYVSLGQAF